MDRGDQFMTSRSGEHRNVAHVVTTRLYREHDAATLDKILKMDGPLNDLELIGRLYTETRDDGSITKAFACGELHKLASITGMPIFLEHSYPTGVKLPSPDQLNKFLYVKPTKDSVPIGFVDRVYPNIFPGELWVKIRMDPRGLTDSEAGNLRRYLRESMPDLSIGYRVVNDPTIAERDRETRYFGDAVRRHDNTHALCAEASLTHRGDVSGSQVIMVKASADVDGQTPTETIQALYGNTEGDLTTNKTSIQMDLSSTDMEVESVPTDTVAGTVTDAPASMEVDAGAVVEDAGPNTARPMETGEEPQDASLPVAEVQSTDARAPSAVATIEPALSAVGRGTTQIATTPSTSPPTPTGSGTTTTPSQAPITVRAYQSPPEWTKLQEQMESIQRLLQQSTGNQSGATSSSQGQVPAQVPAPARPRAQALAPTQTSTLSTGRDATMAELLQLVQRLAGESSKSEDNVPTPAPVQQLSPPPAPEPRQPVADDSKRDTLTMAIQQQLQELTTRFDDLKRQQSMIGIAPHIDVVAEHIGVGKEVAERMLSSAGSATATDIVNAALAAKQARAITNPAPATVSTPTPSVARQRLAAPTGRAMNLTTQNLNMLNRAATTTTMPPSKVIRVAGQEGPGMRAAAVTPPETKPEQTYEQIIASASKENPIIRDLQSTARYNAKSALADPRTLAALSLIGFGVERPQFSQGNSTNSLAT
jgi:hypothetical protein